MKRSMRRVSVLILERDQATAHGLAESLQGTDFRILIASSREEALHLFETDPPDVVVTESMVAGMDAQRLLEEVRESCPRLRALVLVVVVRNAVTLGEVVRHVSARGRRGMNDHAWYAAPDGCLGAPGPCQEHEACWQGLIGECPGVREVKFEILRIAKADTTVLITGETGTGKEVVASLLHQLSSRRGHRFVSINCAAIADGLIESELFGHERGAYTSADARTDGKFLVANGGTVFLDEVGDMSLRAQAKVLRAIETQTVSRVGGTDEIPLDIRLVAATNKDLMDLVRHKQFREDLYYRLAADQIALPALRDRKDDLRLLVDHFLRSNAQDGEAIHTLSKDAWRCLRAHSWPGNVRELKNTIQSACRKALSGHIEARGLPKVLQAYSGCLQRAALERERVLAVLEDCGGNKSKAAAVLHCDRSKIYRAIKRNGGRDTFDPGH